MNLVRRFLSELTTGARSLARRPLYSALCLVTLSLGIGSAVAMSAVVHVVLLRPLPVLDQDRLLFVTKHPRNDRQVLPFSYAEQTAISRLSGIVAASGGSQYDAPLPYGLRVGRQAFNVNVTSVTGGFFAVLGTRAELGRLTVTADQAEPALVISRRLWHTRFGGDSSVVGKSVRLAESFSATIIGISPAGFDFPHGSDAWYLVRPPAGSEEEYAWFSGVVRLTPGTSPERLRAAVQLIVSRDTTQGTMVAEVRPFLDAAIGNLRGTVAILSIAAGLVFLVAMGNAACLLLVQGSARARELAIRSALGASRPRIVRLLTIEASLLAAGAAGLGAGLTLLVLRALALLTPAEVARVGEVEPSPLLLAAASAAATAAVLLFGTLPAIWLSRRSPFSALRSAQAGSDALGGSGRIRELLVTVQVALGVIVAAGAGLMIRTLDNLNRLDLGVDRAQVTVVRVTPGAAARELSAEAAVFETTSMGQAIHGQLARPRFSAALLGGFAAVTLVLMGTGLFATVSALVQQRTREIGIRIALGARPLQLGRWILSRGLRIAGIGLAAGLLASLVATRLIRGLLFGIQGADPLVMLLTTVLVTTIGVLACLGPTLRAARIDPMRSLREE